MIIDEHVILLFRLHRLPSDPSQTYKYIQEPDCDLLFHIYVRTWETDGIK